MDCGPLALYSRLRADLARTFPQKRVLRIYLTHGHSDHAGAGLRCINEGIEVWAATGEREMLGDGGPLGVPQAFRYPAFQPTSSIDEGHRITLDRSCHLVALPTPRHTPGSVCFYDEENGILLYGDNLFGPVWGYGVTFMLEFITTLRQPRYEIMQQQETLGLLRQRLEGQARTLVVPGHGPPYYLDEHPAAFDRSLGILRWALRLKGALRSR